jgi:hypothetical protein
MLDLGGHRARKVKELAETYQWGRDTRVVSAIDGEIVALYPSID